MFSILFVGTDLIQKFMFVVALEVYIGLINGSRIYMQFGFNQVAYIV